MALYIRNSPIQVGTTIKILNYNLLTDTSCRRAAATICPRPPLSSPRGRRSALHRQADGNVTAVSHVHHVPTLTAAAAWRANTAVSKSA